MLDVHSHIPQDGQGHEMLIYKTQLMSSASSLDFNDSVLAAVKIKVSSFEEEK